MSSKAAGEGGRKRVGGCERLQRLSHRRRFESTSLRARGGGRTKAFEEELAARRAREDYGGGVRFDGCTVFFDGQTLICAR